MADTIRQSLISAIASGLGSIRTANGYQTNIGKTVVIATTRIDRADLPAITVWPNPETAIKMSGKYKNTMPVRVVALSLIGPNDEASEVAEKMLGDLKSRIESQTSDISGGYADHVEYYSGGPENYPEPGETIVNCGVVYNFIYRSKIGNPYSQ